jgi:hypothetical protein
MLLEAHVTADIEPTKIAVEKRREKSQSLTSITPPADAEIAVAPPIKEHKNKWIMLPLPRIHTWPQMQSIYNYAWKRMTLTAVDWRRQDREDVNVEDAMMMDLTRLEEENVWEAEEATFLEIAVPINVTPVMK